MGDAKVSNYVTVEEIFTRSVWLRKVGNGPFRRVDLSFYGGLVPVVFGPGTDWEFRESWASPDHAKLLEPPR